jgi:hypothetical protein
MSGTLQVGGVTLGTHNSGTGKVDLTNAGATTVTTLNTTSIASGTLGSSVVVPASIGASMVLLNTTTISSNTAHINWDNTIITSTYNMYKVSFQGISKDGDNFDPSLRFSVDNGSNFVTMRSTFEYYKLNGSGNGLDTNMDNGLRLGIDVEGDSVGALSGCAEVIIPHDAGMIDVQCWAWCTVQNQGGDYYAYSCFASSTTQSGNRVNYMRFIDDAAGNIDVGKISVYGIKH